MVSRRRNTIFRQKQIITAVRRLIVKYGSEHLTLKRISKEIGTSEGDIYRHFKSKKDILSMLIDHIGNNLEEDIRLAQTGNRSSFEMLEGILGSHFSTAKQKQGISFQVIAEVLSLGDKKLNRRISATIDKYVGHLKDVLSQGVQREEIRQDVDLEAAATLLFSMIQGVVSIWALSNYSFDPETKYIPLWSIYREAMTRR